MFRKLSLAVALLALPGTALAQQYTSRVMVLLDTSGSMGFYFHDPMVAYDWPGGDGSTQYTDSKTNNVNLWPGKLTQGVRQGTLSRMYSAKQAITNAVNAFSGAIDFGLMTFDFQLCPFNNPRCDQCFIVNGVGYNCLYYDNAFTKLDLLNWRSVGCAPNGGRVITLPGAGSAQKLLPWIDGVEVHLDSGDGVTSFGTTGTPRNPEIRASGSTPLAEAIAVAKRDWYEKVRGSDPQINCRPYSLIVATDGIQSCGDPCPVAKSLYDANPNNPVKTYVIGMAIGQSNQQVLNSLAVCGGTGQARFANSGREIEAAFADIAAASVKYEACNNRDDNCNAQVDEGFDRGAKCSVGEGACLRGGIKKCTQDTLGTQCCVDDGNLNAPCVPLMAGKGSPEKCNGVDDDCNGVSDDPPVCTGPNACKPLAEVCNNKDDDCDGVVDNAPVDVAQPCGLNLGECKPGRTVCTNGNLTCQGATAPKPEICNGKDDDCDGVTDGMTRPCYSGAQNTLGQGTCSGGQQKCSAGVFGACQGEILPGREICNGLDDDCNGKVDDVPGAGAACCPSGKCGVGVCTGGTQQCSGGSLQCLGGQGPAGEICDGLDNDCNGQADDLPNLGRPCTPQGGCGGKLACDLMKQQVVCQPVGMMAKEVCNGTDDDCDGLVDEKDPDIVNDPKIAQPCGNPMSLPPPCLAGKTACRNGAYICEGAMGPQMEVCDGKDNDCDGQPDNAAPCPANFVCFQGACDPLCGAGEIPCPGGFTTEVVGGKCVCVPEQLCDPPCQAPLYCKKGKCVDRCDGVTCKAPLRCLDGACYGCEKFGCPDKCTRCEPATHECVADRCCNVKCDPGQFCNPADGKCVGTCNPPCPNGQRCDGGKCVGNPCAKVECKQGESCDPQTGQCKANKCAYTTCGANLACCQDMCQADPCLATTCPGGTACKVDQLTCQTRCDALLRPEERQEIVTAGGAFSCAVAPGRSSPGHPLLLGLAVLLLLALRRRR